MGFKISSGEGVSYFQPGVNICKIVDVEIYTDRNGKDAFKIEVENSEGKTTFVKCECPNYQSDLERRVSSIQNFLAEVNRPYQGEKEKVEDFSTRVEVYNTAMSEMQEKLTVIAQNYKDNSSADYDQDSNWDERLENLYPTFKDCLDLFFNENFGLMNAIGKEGYGVFEYSDWGDKRYINPYQFGRFAIKNDEGDYSYPCFFSFDEPDIEPLTKTKKPILLVNPVAPKPKAGENGAAKKEGDPGW